MSHPVAPTPSESLLALQSLRPQITRAAIFGLIASLLVLAPSVYMLEVYARVVDSRSHATLLWLTVMVIVAYIVMEVLEWSRTEILRQAGHQFEEQLIHRTFQAIFQANLRKAPGGTAQPMADLRNIRDFIHSPFVNALFETPSALVFLVLIFAISPVLGLFAAAGAVVQTLIASLNDRSTQPQLLEANRSHIASQQYADTSLRNAEVIHAMGMLQNLHRIWHEKQRHFLGLQAQASQNAGAYQAAGKFWQQVISSGLLGLACWALLHNQLNGGEGMMIIASIFGGRVLAPLTQIVSNWQPYINSRAAWSRLDQLLRQYPAEPPGMALPSPKGRLLVENIIATAPGGQVPILRGVSFALQPGEVLAIVGPSASGKTTLARLLVGLWPAANGKVRLDGADIHTWNKLELGPHIGYLPQGVEVFDGTIAENIARFTAATPRQVQEAAAAVDLHTFIQSLPLGYDTPVGRGGIQLSGGQRQRLALARAVFGQPAYVVLDEPNASLDQAGDQALINAITQLKALGTTFIIITHRANILSVADKMLLLRDGTAQAFGPRDEVLIAIQKAQAAAKTAPVTQAPLATQP